METQGVEVNLVTADAAGEYAMICYIPGHAIAGMVVPFTVSADGTFGATQ